MSMPGYASVAMVDLQNFWPEVLAGTMTPEEMAQQIDAGTNEFMQENGYLS